MSGALNPKLLGQMALDCILSRDPVTITHPPGWERSPGFPLPIKRMPPSGDGSVTQTYRPIAILEYVDDVLQDEEIERRKAESEVPSAA